MHNLRSTFSCPNGFFHFLAPMEFFQTQWPEFSRICQQKLSSININCLSVSQLYSAFETTLREAAYVTIPQTKYMNKISVPLWNKDCEVAIKNQLHALYRTRRTISSLYTGPHLVDASAPG